MSEDNDDEDDGITDAERDAALGSLEVFLTSLREHIDILKEPEHYTDGEIIDLDSKSVAFRAVFVKEMTDAGWTITEREDGLIELSHTTPDKLH